MITQNTVARRIHRGRLFRKYFLLILALVCGVLLVSGGVSMGEWDLVPRVFDALGVTVHFRAVRMKPGARAFTWILSVASSTARARVSWETPPLLEQ